MNRKLMHLLYVKKEPKSTNLIPLMAFLAFASLMSSLATIAHLEPEDKLSLNRGLLLFAMGSVFFTSFYNCTNEIVHRTSAGQRLVKRFKLTTADVYDISNKVVSAVQALLSCLTGMQICTYSCPRDLLRTSHHISHAYSWFGASYFFYDIWSMYMVHSSLVPAVLNTAGTGGGGKHINGDSHHQPTTTSNGEITGGKSKPRYFVSVRAFLHYVKVNPIIIGHHLFIGIFGFSVIIYLRGNLGDCVFGFVFLMEASTPFVSLRSILSRFDMKTSKLYVCNGLAMLIIFFLCRIAMFPYVMHMYAKAAQLEYIQAVLSLPTGCKISICVLMLPQFYWFYLMVKGATKILNKPKQQQPVVGNTGRYKKKSS